MRRQDLIPFLLNQPRTLSQIARELELHPKEAAVDIEHLLRSLRHRPYAAEFIPARCRKCDFRFENGRLTRPSRCPSCHGTWIAEARIRLHEDPPVPVVTDTD